MKSGLKYDKDILVGKSTGDSEKNLLESDNIEQKNMSGK